MQTVQERAAEFYKDLTAMSPEFMQALAQQALKDGCVVLEEMRSEPNSPVFDYNDVKGHSKQFMSDMMKDFSGQLIDQIDKQRPNVVQTLTLTFF